jgi:hypothetical protein
LEELSSTAGRRGWVTAEARSYAAEGALAYAPVAAWLRTLGHARLPDREHRHELMEATAEALLAVPAPLLLVADDLQWADRETLQFVHFVLRSHPAARLLIAATARPEDVDGAHPLSALLTALRLQERIVEIKLARLSRDHTAALATALGAPRPPRRLFEETEGNPLFVVETVRAGAAMTPRVRALLAARLAELSDGARELLGWPRRSAGSSPRRSSPPPRGPASRRSCAGSTSCGGAASCARTAPRATTSATGACATRPSRS